MARVAESPPFSDRPAAMMATAELALVEADWPRFRAVLADVAAQDGGALRDGSQPHALGGSLACADHTQVAYKQWGWTTPPETRATLYVVATRGGEGWRAAADALFRRLAREWPGALTVREAGV